MKKWTWKRGLAAMLGLVLGIQTPLGSFMLTQISYAYTARSATINASSLNVRSGPGTSYSKVDSLTRGTAVTVINETAGSDGRVWYQIRFTGSGGVSSSGYVLNTYVKFPVSYSHDADFESYLTAQGFPESYKDGLRQLHAQHPSWVFTAQNTGLDWNTVIENESVLGRNLVHTSSISSYKSLVDGAYNWDNGVWTGFDGSTWVAASEDIIRYYMDPRNFLDEVSVFQFLDQTYDASLHTKDGLQTMLNGTFMEGTAGGSSNSASGSSGSSSGGGPGVSAGPGGSSGSSGNTVSSGGSGAVSTPGGQSAVIIAPGNSGDNAGNSAGSNAGSSSDNGISFTAPTKGASDVQLIAPQASISRNEAFVVGTAVITAGPGSVSSVPGSAVSVPGNGSISENRGGQLYADILMDAASQSGVNPYVLAAMIIQEQGSDGRGNSISGNYGGYSGYYNYFNVGAYTSDGMSAVERGLWYASQSGNYGRPWNSVYSSIIGGAQFYGSNYVQAGQDTLYLKKFNVQGSNLYKHQYMTNVDGASAEGCIFAEGFSSQLKATALQFKIPVYKNMPDTACAKPTRDGSPNNKLNALGANGFALTPTFNKNTMSYDLIVDYSVSDVTIYANAIDSKASISGTGTIMLQSGTNEIRVQVQAENGDQREYVIHVVRQNNGPVYNAGIGGQTSTAENGDTISAGPGESTGVSGGPGAVSSGSTVTLIGPGG
ncbi:MAG: SH3 domain-containing protein [Brotaphodocola sp.]